MYFQFICYLICNWGNFYSSNKPCCCCPLDSYLSGAIIALSSLWTTGVRTAWNPFHLVSFSVIGNSTTTAITATAYSKVVWTSVHAHRYFFSCWFPALTNGHSLFLSSLPFYLWKGVENIMNVVNNKTDCFTMVTFPDTKRRVQIIIF